jgi:hypothetical protein
MSRPERAIGGPFASSHPGRWIGLLGFVILVLITVNTVLTPSNGLTGLAPGTPLPPFAAPLASGDLEGAVNVAARANDGLARHAACTVRGPQVLNVCQLYEQGPVVLALFIDASACDRVLGEMQALAAGYPTVRFAAVAIKGSRSSVRALVRSHHLTFPVALDPEGVLPVLYKMATCPQLTFARRGGVVQSKALLTTPSPAQLRARVAQLVASEAGGGGGTR